MAAVPRTVHVVTRGCGDRPARPPSLFGIHRTSYEESTSYVLAFERVEHAMAIARGLEAYRRHHGVFPSRDSTAIAELGELEPHRGPMQHVAVDAVDLMDLADRLRGTGIVLSLLAGTCWKDLLEDDPGWRLAKLNAAWQATADGTAFRDGPQLLPKPSWPPVKSATALGYLIANHIVRFWK